MKISSKLTILAVVAVVAAVSSANATPINWPPITRAPDAGTTMPLLGMALIAVDAIRRKLKA